MKFGPEQIDCVVEEVVQRLRGLSAGGAFTSGSDQQSREPENQDPPREMLTIGAHVVTLVELDGRLQGVKEVAIGPRAIVTPAVRDELRRYKIQIKRMAAGQMATGQTQEHGKHFNQCLNQPSLVVAVCQSGNARQEWLERLGQQGMDRRPLADPCLVSLIEQIAPLVVDEKRLGMVVTDKTAPALCLANRQPGIRAILARSEKTIQHDARSVGANLLVLSPSGRSSYQLERLALAFQREGQSGCPEEYRILLG